MRTRSKGLTAQEFIEKFLVLDEEDRKNLRLVFRCGEKGAERPLNRVVIDLEAGGKELTIELGPPN